MKHYGDITQLSGYDLPVVDCIVGGSPCQDLSVAGKRAGLDGERSGLFMEQIRIVKEMREKDGATGRSGFMVRPRYLVWENVPGAFSSKGGADFAAVLEEAIRVAEPKAPSVSVPEKGWPTAGCIVGEQWSIAWRVLDAQFWGTSDKPLPQRRRRIALVADFGGLSAPEILFVRESVSGDLEPGKPPRQATAGDVGEGSDGAGDSVVYGISPYHSNCMKSDNPNIGYYEADTARSLDAQNCGYPACNQGGMAVVQPTVCIEGNGSRPSHKGDGYCESGTMYTLNATEHHGVAYTYDARGNGDGQTVATLTGDHQNRVTDYTSVVMESVSQYWDGTQCAGTLTANNAGGNQRMPDKENFNCIIQVGTFQNTEVGWWNESDMGATLRTPNGDHGNLVVAGPMEEPIAIDRAYFNQGKNAQYEPQLYDDGTVSTLVSKGPSAVAVRHIVRRLTPLECERLQGYPDGWTDIGEWIDTNGKKHKEADSPRYKALGNSIALPPWKWVLKRLCACYERDATLASLFDGISGFPLIWTQFNGLGSVKWTSEIEEFPIAVCKRHFGDEETGEEGDFYEAIRGRCRQENV